MPEPPTVLYHYCPDYVLPNILSSRKLWASDVLCMNDSKEVAYAFNDVIAPLVSQREDGKSKYFIESVAAPDLVREIWGVFTHTLPVYPQQPNCRASGKITQNARAMPSDSIGLPFSLGARRVPSRFSL